MTEPGDRIEGLTPLQRATLALKEMRVRLDAVEKARQEPLALVGIACRFPGGANDPEAYWQLLRQGVDGISDVPPGRWNADAFYDPAPGARGKMRVRRSGFLKGHDVDCFDAPFFGIAPIEANSLDPQHRLLLELTWEALEDAGLPAERLAGSRTGVFVGIATADYAQIVMRELGLEDVDGYVTTGNAANTAAGRLSYVLGSRGPAVALDTACSSSLVALHLACRSLRSGESDLALVGGVNLILTPDVNVLYSQMGALAPDGWCKSFDASADGMVRGEGGAVIAVKRLADALRDGDRVLALVRGSAVNHDGRSSGLSVPSGTAQREVLRSALADAGVMPAAVHLVEAHGTGTTLGDPIEAEALIAEMGAGRPDGTPLVLGAAKASIGHLEAAAGLAGLVKVALAMKHREIPPQMHFSSLNPEIAPGRFPLVVPTKPLPWPDSERPRIAGVSAFGVSGTNAHVILEAPRLADRKPGASDGEALPQPEAWLLPISARSAGALRELATAYEKIVTERRDVGLADLCFSAAVRRSHLEQRLAVVGRSREELAEGLAAFVRGELDPRFFKGALQPGRRPRLAFVFSGYGEPWPGMGRALLEREPAFREAIKGCDQEIGRHLSWSVHERLATGGAAAWEHPAMAQPLLFSVQVALAALWRSWGVEPAAVVGHSMGEIAAAHVAGALSLEDATLLVCRRSEIVRRAPGKGAMAVVGLSLAQALEALAGYEDRLGVSVCNGRALVVLSGEPEALHDVVAGLAHRNVFTRLMKEGAAAAHSPQMDAVLPELLAALQGLVPRATQVPLYSTVTAALSEGETLGPEYWARNLREPVLFAQTIEQIGNDGYDAFLEISPHPMLLGAIEQVLRPQGGEIALAPSLKSDEPEEATLRASAGRLWTAGVPMDFGRLYPAGRFVPLPRYPWQRQRYWVGSRPAHALQASTSPARAGAPHPLLDRLNASARAPGEILGELEIDEDRLPFLGALRLQGVGIVPVPVLAEMALAAASALPLDAAAVVEDLVVHDQILLDGGVVLQIAASPAAEGHVFQIFNRPRCGDGEWTACASGRLLPACSDPPAGEPVEAVRGRCAAPADVASIASQSLSRGLDRGAALRCVEQLSCAAGEALACLELPEGAGAGTFALHPAFLDGVFQVLSALADDPEVPPVPGEVALPTGLGRLVVHRPGLLVGSLLCHAVLRSAGGPANEILGDARLLDESGALVAEISGARLRPPGRRVARQIVSELLPTWRYAMVWEPRTELPSAGEGGQQPLAPGYWLVLADRSGLGTALAAEMRQRGDEVLLVQTGPGLSTPAQGPWEVPAEG
jgi:myxalamid-type polyketide synthase MxaE and MxaD